MAQGQAPPGPAYIGGGAAVNDTDQAQGLTLPDSQGGGIAQDLGDWGHRESRKGRAERPFPPALPPRYRTVALRFHHRQGQVWVRSGRGKERQLSEPRTRGWMLEEELAIYQPGR